MAGEIRPQGWASLGQTWPCRGGVHSGSVLWVRGMLMRDSGGRISARFSGVPSGTTRAVARHSLSSRQSTWAEGSTGQEWATVREAPRIRNRATIKNLNQGRRMRISSRTAQAMDPGRRASSGPGGRFRK